MISPYLNYPNFKTYLIRGIEQQFELAIGQNTTVTGTSPPIEVSAVSE
jgi:hypothetical protein